MPWHSSGLITLTRHNTVTTTTAHTAKSLLAWFNDQTRDGGKRFYSLRSGCPDDVSQLVQDCHDGELPNDWRYDVIVSILHDLDGTQFDENAPMIDNASDIADGQVEVFNSDLATWLADQPARSDYIDQAREEFGGLEDCIWSQIKAGQYVAITQMVMEIMEFLS